VSAVSMSSRGKIRQGNCRNDSSAKSVDILPSIAAMLPLINARDENSSRGWWGGRNVTHLNWCSGQ
jgi:hypothetical protein